MEGLPVSESSDPELGNVSTKNTQHHHHHHHRHEKNQPEIKENEINIQIKQENNPEYNDKWRDLPFAIAYYSSIVFSIIFGTYLITRGNTNDDNQSTNDSTQDSNGNAIYFDFNILQIFAGILSAILFTILWLSIIIRYSKCIIKAGLLLFPIAFFTLGFIFLFVNLILGIMFIIIGAICIWYAYSVWNRIAFSAALLGIAVEVFREYYAPLFINMLMGLLSFVMLIIDILIFIGTINSIESSSLQLFIFFLCMLLIYWHNITLINVGHVTASGVMATWFFSTGEVESSVTTNSFRRAITTSFGSICFGSLIEAIIRALAALARYLQERARRDGNMAMCVIACVLRCILNMLGDIVEYINSYAFVYVAMYGYTYIHSAKQTFQLFKSRGIQALINDDLTNIPFIIGGILCVIFIILICILVGDFDGNIFIAVIFGFIIYYCVVYTLVSYIKTLFVCWLEDPNTLKMHRPLKFQLIVNAANNQGCDTQWCQENEKL